MKNILIVANKMNMGGTEVSLLNTIKELKKKNVKITLALLKKEGIYLEKVPKDIKIIEILNEKQNKLFEKTNFKRILMIFNFKFIFMKILKKINPVKMYIKLLKEIEENNENYDIAIDFHGYGYFGTAYVIEKVRANKKIMFIHDEKIDCLKNVENWIDRFDKIFCVSKSCINIVKKRYAFLENKLDEFHNIIDEGKIDKLSMKKIEKLSDKINLLTIGRLEYQKGYDLLVNIAEKLDRLKYTWYIIGAGSLSEEIKKSIIEKNLQENVIMLGMKTNPYPYIKNTDIYIQTSRHEGYGIAIAEARYFNKPIIATKLDCIKEQIEDGETGVLCKFVEDEFVNAINDLISNPDKRERLSNNLRKNGFKDKNEINKLLED